MTSLSTTTSAPRSDSRTKPGTSKPSQPGMIGGLVGLPVANSTGPGTPTPTATTSVMRRPARRTSTLPRSTTQARTFSGPTPMSRSTTSSASTVAARSLTARRTWVAPMSAPRTTRARGLKAKRAGGRPPVDVASPAAPTRLLVMSVSTRWATVDRPRPVSAASSLRVRGVPSRSSCSRAPALPARWLSTVVLNHTDFPSHQSIFCLTTGRSRLGSRTAAVAARGRGAGTDLLSNRGQPGDTWHEPRGRPT